MLTEVFPRQAGSSVCPTAEGDLHHPPSIARAIGRLSKARCYAADTGRNIWEFAVTIDELRRDGINESDLRWLVCRGYVEHAREISTTCPEREYDHHVSLRFCKRTAFTVTDAGITFGHESLERLEGCNCTSNEAATSLTGSIDLALNHEHQDTSHETNGSILPKWDRDRRELRCNGQLVKAFKLPSPLQETILIAFEEEHWPPRIDDPLPVHPDLCPKRRLHDTIKSLNRNQKHNLIRFMGDGTGEGIRWELIASRD